MSRIRVGVVLFDKNNILVIRMHRDTGDIFVLPGGGLENEGIYECGIREVKEETNIDVVIERVLYVKDLVTDTDHALEIVLLGKIIKGKIRKGYDPEEKGRNVLKEVVFVPLSQLKNINFHPKQLRATIEQDAKDNFKNSPKYLGKHRYPED